MGTLLVEQYGKMQIDLGIGFVNTVATTWLDDCMSKIAISGFICVSQDHIMLDWAL